MKILVIILSFFVMSSVYSSCIANDYLIKNVKVDVNADNALQARKQGLDQARMNAFNVLKGRLVQRDQVQSLPHLSSDQIASMVDSFEINKEKLSQSRYLASVNVSFNQRAVQSYLGRFTTQALPDNFYETTSETYNRDDKPYDTMHSSGNPYSTQDNRSLFQGSAAVSTYKIQIDLRNLRDWVGIQRSLQSVGSVRIDSLNVARAVVTLGYGRDALSLQNDLKRKGMTLYQNASDAVSVAPYVLIVKG